MSAAAQPSTAWGMPQLGHCGLCGSYRPLHPFRTYERTWAWACFPCAQTLGRLEKVHPMSCRRCGTTPDVRRFAEAGLCQACAPLAGPVWRHGR